jgi:DNA-binding XRE family transcriptional regulator
MDKKIATVAHDLKISESVISQIENGKYNCLSLDLLTKLARYYEKDMDVLMQKAK